MDDKQTQSIFSDKMDRLIASGAPAGGVLISSPRYRQNQSLGIDAPRLSICLTGRAQYDTLASTGRSLATLEKHHMIFAGAYHVMQPHAAARYTSIGVVFYKQFTQFIYARKRVLASGVPQHQAMHLYHSARWADESTLHLCRALEHADQRDPNDPYIAALMRALLIQARELLLAPAHQPQQSKARFTWLAARQYVHEHLGAPLSREDVAAFLRLHPNHISRLFHHFSEQSFTDYIMEKRLASAREMLADPRMNISEIAYACGFSGANYFIRCYRRHFGHSPGKDRR